MGSEMCIRDRLNIMLPGTKRTGLPAGKSSVVITPMFCPYSSSLVSWKPAHRCTPQAVVHSSNGPTDLGASSATLTTTASLEDEGRGDRCTWNPDTDAAAKIVVQRTSAHTFMLVPPNRAVTAAIDSGRTVVWPCHPGCRKGTTTSFATPHKSEIGIPPVLVTD